MNLIKIATLLAALAALAATAADRTVMVAPFDNLSRVRDYTEYDTDIGTSAGNPRSQYRVDRYSHATREILEDIIMKVPGVQPVERAQFGRVTLEVSGSIHDGLNDPEKTQRVALSVGAEGIIAGTIIDMNQSSIFYDGYTRIRSDVFSVVMRVRLIDLTKRDAHSNIVAAVTFAREIKGKYLLPQTPYLRIKNADPFFTAIKNALEKLDEDPSFKSALAGKVAETSDAVAVSTEIEFNTNPTNSSVFFGGETGWKYVGQTPLKKKLRIGSEPRIRLEHSGYTPWESAVEVSEGLRVIRDLEPLTPRSNTPN